MISYTVCIEKILINLNNCFVVYVFFHVQSYRFDKPKIAKIVIKKPFCHHDTSGRQ